MNADEESRAAAYRERIQRFERLRLEREVALAGDPAELAQLKADWEPVLRDPGWEPVILVGDPEEAVDGGAVVN